MGYAIMLEPGDVIPLEFVPPIEDFFEALKHHDDPKKKLVDFPTPRPHPTKRDSMYLSVEIDSIGRGLKGDGPDWLIVCTLSRRGDFWSTVGDSSRNPKVKIAHNGDKQSGALELHLDS
ncbi:MAG: hypothetical protein Q7T74_04365 [Candidatus Saccharibacteria bacterium]|nr:hypothetical protein [Candidatus Saccharibacteria bacterium]